MRPFRRLQYHETAVRKPFRLENRGYASWLLGVLPDVAGAFDMDSVRVKTQVGIFLPALQNGAG